MKEYNGHRSINEWVCFNWLSNDDASIEYYENSLKDIFNEFDNDINKLYKRFRILMSKKFFNCYNPEGGRFNTLVLNNISKRLFNDYLTYRKIKGEIK